MSKLIDLKEFPPITIGQLLSQISSDSQGQGSGVMLETAISKFESDHNTDQSNADDKEQNMLPLQKRGGQFFQCADCPYVQETEQELLDHVESYHATNEGQSEITHGIQENNMATGYQEKGNEDLDKFTASEMPEHLPTQGTYFMEYYNDNGIKEGSKSVRKTAPYKCESCDFTTNRQYALKSHIRYDHYGSQEGSKLSCPLCDFSSTVADNMIEHSIKFHPQPSKDKPTAVPFWSNSRGDKKKKSPYKNTTKAVAKDKLKPKEKSRLRRDLNNAMERQRRVNQHIGFDQLKDNVPKFRDAKNRVSKKVILDGAAEYCKMLRESDLKLSAEREQVAKRNAELRRRLEEAKRKLNEDMFAPSYGLMDDFGYSSFESDLFPSLESPLDM